MSAFKKSPLTVSQVSYLLVDRQRERRTRREIGTVTNYLDYTGADISFRAG